MALDCYIYVLVDPREPTNIRYVGKTIHPKTRAIEHKSRSSKGKTHKDKWVKKLAKDNIEPTFIILCQIDEKDWKMWEMFYIKRCRDLGHSLTNTAPGGDGTHYVSEKTRKLLSDKHKGKPSPMKGKKYTTEELAKRPPRKCGPSHGLYGRKRPESHCQAISDALAGKPRKKEEILDRFMRHVIPVTECGCWLYDGFIMKHGYCTVWYKTKKITCSQLAWILHYGEVPSGQCVSHKCSIKTCVNPAHLFLRPKGTRAIGQAPSTGENNSQHRLTEHDVKYILKTAESPAVLADKFSVSMSTITAIRRRECWKHINIEEEIQCTQA